VSKKNGSTYNSSKGKFIVKLFTLWTGYSHCGKDPIDYLNENHAERVAQSMGYVFILCHFPLPFFLSSFKIVQKSIFFGSPWGSRYLLGVLLYNISCLFEVLHGFSFG
jgi:hypothetical protein